MNATLAGILGGVNILVLLGVYANIYRTWIKPARIEKESFIVWKTLTDERLRQGAKLLEDHEIKDNSILEKFTKLEEKFTNKFDALTNEFHNLREKIITINGKK